MIPEHKQRGLEPARIDSQFGDEGIGVTGKQVAVVFVVIVGLMLLFGSALLYIRWVNASGGPR